MEKIANLGLFAVHKIVSECEESILTYSKKYAERINAYMEKMQKDCCILLIRQETRNWAFLS